jgi:stage V sporulation protein B
MATITLTFYLTSRLTALLLALFQMGATGVIIGYIVGSVIAIVLALSLLHKKLPRTTEKISLKPLLHFSFPLFLSSVTELVLSWADVVILTSLTGDLSLTGIYHIVVNSVGALGILYISVNTTIFPALSAHHGLEKPQNISKTLKTTSRYLIYILLPSCIGLAIIAPTALTFFYGPSYVKGALPLAILSITTIIMALLSLCKTTFQAIGKTGQILKINIIAAISSVLMLLSLVPLFETTGAAFARITTQAIVLVVAVYILRREIKIQIDKEAIWKATVSTLATVPFLLAIELILSKNFSTTQTLALELLTATGIYAVSIYALKALKKQDFQLLRQAFPKPLTKYINILERIIVR